MTHLHTRRHVPIIRAHQRVNAFGPRAGGLTESRPGGRSPKEDLADIINVAIEELSGRGSSFQDSRPSRKKPASTRRGQSRILRAGL